MRYRKLRINPLESIADRHYCRFCKDETDTEVDEGRWGTLWVYRRRCLRCGQRIQWGVARAALQNPTPELAQQVASWIVATGKDRT